MNIIEALDKEQLRSDIPEFRAGDTVKVYVKVVEGTRERVQLFEGVEVPEVLRNGNHKLIARWRRKQALKVTYLLRPDMLPEELDKQDKKLLEEIKDEL